MKIVIRNLGLLSRLSILATALLLGQQALAAGTNAGVTVSNQALVAYDVAGEPQTAIDSDPVGNSVPGNGNATLFLVDRRVDWTMASPDAVPTDVTPGVGDFIAAFTLTNDSNAIMDWELTLVDLPDTTDVNGFDDTGDLMVNYRIYVANGGGVPDPLTDLSYVDELGEDLTVVIHVYADAPLTLTNDAIDNFNLVATAADHALATATPGVLDPLLLESAADDSTVIDNVFANTNGSDDADPLLGHAVEVFGDGFRVVSAALVITKTALVDSDDFGAGKPTPNAVIEYTVLIDNTTGSSVAQNVVITDTIQIADVTFEEDAYGAGQDVDLGLGAFCEADNPDALPDGCIYIIGTGALTIAVPDIGIGASRTITYQVRIN